MKPVPFLLIGLLSLVMLLTACQRQPSTRILGERAESSPPPATGSASASSPAATAAASSPTTTEASFPQEAGNAPGNNLRGGPYDVHALLLDESAADFSRGTTDQVTIQTKPPGIAIPSARAAAAAADSPLTVVYTSRVINTAFPFNDLVPSWNVEMPEGTGFRVAIRMGRRAGKFWTPFYHFGTWGSARRPEPLIIEDDNGVIDVDTFRSTQAFDRIQYRFVLTTAAAGQSPVIRRVGLAYSNTLGDEELARTHRKPVDPGSPSRWARRLAVPWRSQKVEDPRIRGSICSPTSVAMVLQYYGVDVPTAQVAAHVFDPEYRIYGNWARAVQTAYAHGVTGYLERFGDFDAVKRHIAAGRPVIASIRVDVEGTLRGAPYRTSNGHLIVVAGFDAKGNLHVNDPAAKTIEAGVVTYAAEDMQKVWLDHGGVGYVLTGKEK